MLETLKQTIIINFSITLNSFIYFIKRGRLTRTIFKNVSYEHAALTEILVVFGIIYSMLNQLFKSILLLGLSFGLPYLIIKGNNDGISNQNVYWQLFIIFYIMLSLAKNKILLPDKRKYISVKLMRMNARQFVISDYFPPLIWRQLIELLLFSIVAGVFSVNIFLALFLVCGKNFFSIFAEVINIKFYDLTDDFLHNKVALIILYSIAIVVIGYLGALCNFILVIPEWSIIGLGIVLWLIGLYSIFFIIRYNKFSVAINDANRLDKLSVDIQNIKRDAEFSKVKFKNEEFTQTELQYDKLNKKEGFHYINEIFFKRHKRILNKPIKIQLVIAVLLFLGGLISLLYIQDFNSIYTTGVKHIFPVFIFALYIMSTGQKATKAMFYNCDVSLLHYGFYKTKTAVLATFTIRAKHLIIANIIPAILLAVELFLLDVISGGNGITFIPIGIMLISLSIFFVIHNLFLYYIFQPYTSDLNVRNPFYKFLNFITYILCYTSLQLRNMSSIFLIVVVTSTVIYSITALIIVYRIAPRTFVIK